MRVGKNVFTILVIIPVIVLAACGHIANERVQLQLNMQAGESYTIRMAAEEKLSQTILGQKQDATNVMTLECTYHVQKVDADGTALVNFTYDSIFLKQHSPDGTTIEYDSSDPPAILNPALFGYAALLGQSFSIVLLPNGKIRDIQGIDEIIKGLIDQFRPLDEAARASIEKSISEQINDEAIKKMMSQVTDIYPDKPVGIGDSWSREVSIYSRLPMILAINFTLKARKSGVAIIEVRSVAKTNPKSEPFEMEGVKLRCNVSGNMKGTMEIEESTGWPIRLRLTERISGQMKLEEVPQISGTISWPISMESILVVDRID